MILEQSAVVRFRRKLQWKREYWWYGPLAAQWLALTVFSIVQFNRFALTHDFALYWQAVWLVAHGHFNPYSSVDGLRFLDNNFELIIYFLAPFAFIFRSALTLLLLQDTFLVAAGVVAWQWIRSIIMRSAFPYKTTLLFLGVALLVLNPWIYWTAAFDFHPESIMVFSVTLSAYGLWRNDRKTTWIGIIMTLLCGDVGALAIFGLGLTALLVKRWRWSGTMLAGSLFWLLLISHIGANKGSVLAPSFGYLVPNPSTHVTITQVIAGLVERPGRALKDLWYHRMNLYSNIAPEGFLGIVNPWALGVGAVIIGISNLTHYAGGIFSAPGFQNAIAYPLITVGTVGTIIWLAAKNIPRYVVSLLVGLVLGNALLWAIVWLPHDPTHWIRVSRGSARVLQEAQSIIPSNAEVITNQGIAGRFAGRPSIHPIMGGTSFSVTSRPVYIVLAPYQGTRFGSVRQTASQLTALSHQSNAKLVLFGSGVYVWRIINPGGHISLNDHVKDIAAWTFGSQTGAPVVGGPPGSWYVSGLGRNGNVVDQAYWREDPGTYSVSVRYASIGPIGIQVWDATTGQILYQRQPLDTNAHQELFTGTFRYPIAGSPHVFGGTGIWRILPVEGHKRNQLEVRVYAKASSMASVYTIGLMPYSP